VQESVQPPVQGSATSGTQYQYTVRLINGGTTIINTEQQDIRPGDCVSIEQCSYANIHRVHGELQITLRSEVRVVHDNKVSSENDRARYDFEWSSPIIGDTVWLFSDSFNNLQHRLLRFIQQINRLLEPLVLDKRRVGPFCGFYGRMP